MVLLNETSIECAFGRRHKSVPRLKENGSFEVESEVLGDISTSANIEYLEINQINA